VQPARSGCQQTQDTQQPRAGRAGSPSRESRRRRPPALVCEVTDPAVGSGGCSARLAPHPDGSTRAERERAAGSSETSAAPSRPGNALTPRLSWPQEPGAGDRLLTPPDLLPGPSSPHQGGDQQPLLGHAQEGQGRGLSLGRAPSVRLASSPSLPEPHLLVSCQWQY